jgi:hypothetical protein
VVLAALNLVAGLALAVYERALAPPVGPLRYGMEKLSRVYPGRGEAEIEDVLRVTWSRGYVYSPFVQHREPAARGRFVNVDRHGFRHSGDQGPWPPLEEELAVFVFGGSTTFGYGLADDETIPSRLQAALAGQDCGARPRVYNFGRGNYYGEQERAQFEALVVAGTIPDVAVFIDGLNEFKGSPKFTERLEYLLAESDGQLIRRALMKMPVVDLLRLLRPGEAADDGAGTDADQELGRRMVERWLRGKRLIESTAAEFGVLPVFVWQPVPTYQYRLESHLFAAESAASLARHGALRLGYSLMDDRRSVSPALEPAGDFLWLADLQRGRRQALYVDAAHYTAAFSDEIARRIAGFVAAAVPCAGFDDGEAG